MTSNLIIALPTDDRRRSYRFYADAFGLEAPGDLADDGAPEPLLIVVNQGVSLMMIPPGGFGWTIAGRPVAGAADPTECQLVLTLEDSSEVDALFRRAVAAGAQVVAEPAQQPWGYVANVADPDGHLWMVLTDPAW